MTSRESVWIFHGEGARFASAVFATVADAEAWIGKHALTALTGMLTEYPLGEGVFDWAVCNGTFTPTKPKHQESAFIGGFTSAAQEHIHFENGVRS